jgi:hypothetical protein
MKLSFLFLFSFLTQQLWAASCCVSNTSISNLMLFPSKWQQTMTFSQGHVVGDVDEDGSSTFRRSNNRDVTNLVKLDLAYGWTTRYQTGFSARYQSRKRDFQGEDSSSSGWNDLGFSHAYKLPTDEKIWIFQTLNVPTARSVYNSTSTFAVDARGTGTYQTSLGFFGLKNFRKWDFLYSYELHRSFERDFYSNGADTTVGSFWGTSLTLGTGYVAWRSKARYGLALTPRYEGAKVVTIDGRKTQGAESLVWDSSVNFSYSFTPHHALGFNYTDQTFVGPARNSLLSRFVMFQWQNKWE